MCAARWVGSQAAARATRANKSSHSGASRRIGGLDVEQERGQGARQNDRGDDARGDDARGDAGGNQPKRFGEHEPADIAPLGANGTGTAISRRREATDQIMPSAALA